MKKQKAFTPTPKFFGVTLPGKGGFTLIEILIVIGIMAILAAIVIIAINPAEQFAQARDAQRKSNVRTILNAVHQNVIRNQGIFDFDDCSATTFSGDAQLITDSGGIDLCGCLVFDFIAAMPTDPDSAYGYTNCTTYNTGYVIRQDATTLRLTVSSTGELTPDISVTR